MWIGYDDDKVSRGDKLHVFIVAHVVKVIADVAVVVVAVVIFRVTLKFKAIARIKLWCIHVGLRPTRETN